MRRARLGRLAAAVVAGTTMCLVAACGSSGSSSHGSGAGGGAGTKTIRIGYFPDISPLSLMKSKHLLEKEGYKPIYIEFLKGIPQEAAAMVGGSVDVIWANASASVATFAKDPGEAYLVGQIVTNDNEIVTGPGSGITSVAQLAGKTLATSGVTTGPQLVVDAAMSKAGVNPSTLKNLTVPGPQQATTLQQKAADAATTYLPFAAEMVKDGGHILTTANQVFDEPFPGGGLVSSKKFADAHPAAVEAVLRAAKQAIGTLRDGTQSSLQELASFDETTPSMIQYGFDHRLVSFATSLVPNMAALTAVAKAEMKYGFVSKGTNLVKFLKTYVNPRFAKAAAS